MHYFAVFRIAQSEDRRAQALACHVERGETSLPITSYQFPMNAGFWTSQNDHSTGSWRVILNRRLMSTAGLGIYELDVFCIDSGSQPGMTRVKDSSLALHPSLELWMAKPPYAKATEGEAE